MGCKKIIATALLLSLAGCTYAGFGRGGSSGGFRSSGFSSSRSYSAPRTYSAPQRTVVREYHHTTMHAPAASSGGMGIGSTIAASAAGSMIGNALTNNHGSSAPAQPQVVYVNGQPQQVAQAAPVPQQAPMQQDLQYAQAAPQFIERKESSHGVAYFFVFLFIIFGLGVAYQLGRRN